MSRFLVVANQTIGGSELMDEIRRRIASGPSSFYVLVPATTATSTAYAKVMASGDTGPSPSATAGFAANDEAMARLTLATGSLGNVRTRTMRAFARDEMRKIISSLP